MKEPWVILAWAGFAVVSAMAAPDDSLGAKAASILQQRCLACHNEKAAMSDLRLTGREDALRGGKRGPAIKPGQPSESLLFQAVAHIGKVTMPPGTPSFPARRSKLCAPGSRRAPNGLGNPSH